EAVRPFLPLAERLGRIWASLGEGAPKSLAVDYQGQLADYDTRILTLAVLKGVLGAGGTDPVSYVNAPQLAEARGLDVQETRTAAAHDYVNLITLAGDGHSLAGSLFGLRDEARLVMVDDHTVDIPPARHMAVVRNDDRPGMIGLVGVTLGRAGINISDMDVGRSPSGVAALMVLSIDRALPAEVHAELRAADGILHVATVDQE
ncbi:MAG TPA: ACT domain-containing protein, partial [Acidimicrobiales bacterium]|nr:ACT domain-containing protein [Acidimicrobiales bacterium]